ncbi:hypothetical protein BGX23_000289 [Mortierella sp. AD031]|nr:hypothetical protein BGX23_000289 [Mortierella sp. AD031]
MVPDPMCPTCYSEFVEKIEADNDPRAFAPPAAPHRPEDGRYGGPGDGHETPINLEDLFQLFQVFYNNPHRTARQQDTYQQQQQQQHQQRQQLPNPFFTTGTQIMFSSGPSGTTRTVTNLGSGAPPTAAAAANHGHGSQHPGSGSEGGQTIGGQPPATATEGGAGGNQQPPPGPQWHSPPSFISGLLNRLGIEVHYTTDPAALSGGFGGPMSMSMGGGFLPMASNPGDYVWGQQGLDDIITQLMNLQNRQHGPVGASDEIINGVPHHTLTDEELEAKTECSVCKDEFTKEDNLLHLPCKHIFHEDCIKPWLKVSGTCPTW